VVWEGPRVARLGQGRPKPCPLVQGIAATACRDSFAYAATVVFRSHDAGELLGPHGRQGADHTRVVVHIL